MKIALNECYVLHRRAFRESSLLLEVFSRQHGRLPLVHRGARKVRNKQHSIQPFQLFLFSWSGRGEIATIRRHEGVGPAVLCRNSDYLCGFYLNELLYRLLHRHESHAELFAAYDHCLRALGSGSDQEQELRYFELELLNSLGYGPTLEHDATGKTLLAETQYSYLPEEGPVLGSYGSGCTVSGATMHKLARRETLDEIALGEAKRLMRSLLQYQMQGQELASHDLYKHHLQAGCNGTTHA